MTRDRSRLGVSGAVSALLTVLLLASGFAVSAGLLSAVYTSQAEVMKRAVNVGEAVAERLQAFVYEDVQSNETLLTIRNVGSTGSEVEYIMAVGYDGSVLAEARLAETIRLGTQQAVTVPLASLLGPAFSNFTEVRSRMATLYLKTVKGGVFGSGYMAPPSVMTAAYATSTTTVTSTETNISELRVETGRTAINTWTATIVLDNPDRWIVAAYVGVAFAQNFVTSGPIQRDGFPSWGHQPGLRAKDWGGDVKDVTSSNDIRIPKMVTCYLSSEGAIYGWGLGSPVYRFSELGPTYAQMRFIGFEDMAGNKFPMCEELFEPSSTTIRNTVITTMSFTTTTQTTWRRGSIGRPELPGWYTTTITYSSPYSYTTDVRDMQKATFPAEISSTKFWVMYGHIAWVRDTFKLAYIKVVDLWNTTKVLAYVRGDEGTTIQLRVDRPVGIAAVYVYDRRSEYIPPPPPPPPAPYTEACYSAVYVCRTDGYYDAINSSGGDVDKSCGNGNLNVWFQCRDPNDPNCKAWVAPGSGTYREDELQECPKDSSGKITCSVPPGSTIIAGRPEPE